MRPAVKRETKKKSALSKSLEVFVRWFFVFHSFQNLDFLRLRRLVLARHRCPHLSVPSAKRSIPGYVQYGFWHHFGFLCHAPI